MMGLGSSWKGMALGAAVLGAALSAEAAEQTIIVLDASGSMWAQIDGTPRIAIAREVLDKVLGDLPADRELGFMAYGHRKKGVCSDIELLVPPAAGTAESIREAAAKLNPKGKTPLSEAVRQAAEALRYTEDAATVVLITDGIENCQLDPCVLGRELEAAGVNFTAHVVGFDLKSGEGAKVACLAEETGGTYIDAANATELTTALTETVAAPPPKPQEPPPPPEPDATLAGPAEVPAGADFEVSWTGPGAKTDYLVIVEAGAPKTATGNFTYINENNPVVLRAPDALGAYEVRYILGDGRKVVASHPVTLTPIQATLEAPAEVPAGAQFEVSWTGPAYRDDFITIVEAGAKEGSYTTYVYANKGSPIQLTAPDGLGNYEVRYVVGQSKRTLASQPVVLTGIEATLEAPAEVAAGAAFEVTWTGPDNKNDYITIVEAGAKEGTYNDYDYTRKGSPLTIEAPDGLGAYEIRYVVGKSKRTLASRPITLVGVQATLEAPAEIPAGASFEVTWTGPDNKNDYVTIVEAGAKEGTYNDYDYTRKGSPLTIEAPDGLGAYEVRYVLGKSKRTLASHPVTLVAIAASLEAPAEIPAGSKFEVTWTGPDNKNDYITIVEAGAKEGTYNDYAYTRKGSPLEITAPDGLGAYEVRYVLGKSKRTLASTPVTLTSIDATLEAPAEVAAGAPFEVSWTGPDNPNDYIAIAEVGAPEGKYLTYSYTRKGNPVTLRAPDMLGKVEIRYVIGKSKRTLKSETITLTPVSAELRVTNTAVPGGKLEVEWQGPNNPNDFIALAEPGAPGGKYLVYAYTRRGNPVVLNVPKILGTYEVRYILAQSKRILTAIPVVIDVAEVSLKAPETVKAGGTLQVSWTGPANWEDFVEIVPAGAPDKTKPLAATRTSQGSPLPIFAPGQPGQYEIRYVMRDTGEVAARIPLTVE